MINIIYMILNGQLLRSLKSFNDGEYFTINDIALVLICGGKKWYVTAGKNDVIYRIIGI